MFASKSFIVYLHLEFGHRILWYNMLYNDLLFSGTFILRSESYSL